MVGWAAGGATDDHPTAGVPYACRVAAYEKKPVKVEVRLKVAP